VYLLWGTEKFTKLMVPCSIERLQMHLTKLSFCETFSLLIHIENDYIRFLNYLYIVFINDLHFVHLYECEAYIQDVAVSLIRGHSFNTLFPNIQQLIDSQFVVTVNAVARLSISDATAIFPAVQLNFSIH
jgi:hypothetical protein